MNEREQEYRARTERTGRTDVDHLRRHQRVLGAGRADGRGRVGERGADAAVARQERVVVELHGRGRRRRGRRARRGAQRAVARERERTASDRVGGLQQAVVARRAVERDEQLRRVVRTHVDRGHQSELENDTLTPYTVEHIEHVKTRKYSRLHRLCLRSGDNAHFCRAIDFDDAQ